LSNTFRNFGENRQETGAFLERGWQDKRKKRLKMPVEAGKMALFPQNSAISWVAKSR
jgi:hypothetical protein